MLDAVCRYMPSPVDKEGIKGTNPKTDEEIIRKPTVSDPFAALAFKIATDPFVGRLAFFRAYSGRLDAGSYVLNTRSDSKERISRIYQMHANKQNPIEYIEAGDIGAAVGFKDIKTGDTLCDEKHPIVLENMFIPEPVISLAVEPKTQADVENIQDPHCVAACTANPDVLWCQHHNGIFRSVDGGKTWSKNVRIARDVCPCCRVAFGFTGGRVVVENGRHVARDRIASENCASEYW